MMNKKKREKTTILSSAGEGEKEITWNSVINPKKTVVAVCSFYTDLSQMLVNSILNGVTKKSVVSPFSSFGKEEWSQTEVVGEIMFIPISL